MSDDGSRSSSSTSRRPSRRAPKSVSQSVLRPLLPRNRHSSFGADEAQASLNLLCTLCPDFAYVKLVDRQEWLCMKGVMGLKEVKETVRVERERASLL